jgi:hypothetical protein
MEYHLGISCDASDMLHKQIWCRNQWDIMHSFFPRAECLKSNLHNVCQSHLLFALSIIPNGIPVLPPRNPAALARIWMSSVWLTPQSTPRYKYSGRKNSVDLSLSVIAHELVEQIHIRTLSIDEELSEIQGILWWWSKQPKMENFDSLLRYC